MEEMKDLTAAESRRRIEAPLIIADMKESKRLWKEQFGTFTGFQKAWKKVWKVEDDGTVSKCAKVVEVPVVGKAAEVVQIVETILTLPEILWQDNQVHNAYTIIQVKGGWCVGLYQIDGKVHTLEQLTEVEGKQFALNRLFNFVRLDIRKK